MCCGRPDTSVAKDSNGQYAAKMPDGSTVMVANAGQEKAERDKVYTRMRSAASKGGYTVTR
jgi:hypothetical protein